MPAITRHSRDIAAFLIGSKWRKVLNEILRKITKIKFQIVIVLFAVLFAQMTIYSCKDIICLTTCLPMTLAILPW
jgi:hypothetical protein